MDGRGFEPALGCYLDPALAGDVGAWLRHADVPHRVHAHAPLPDVAGALASGALPFPPGAWVETIAFRAESGILLLAGAPPFRPSPPS